MSLTPSDDFYKAFDELAIRHEYLGVRKELLEAAVLGLRMGRAEGREQAAKACDIAAERYATAHPMAMRPGAEQTAVECAAVIRALTEEPT